jgi:hypothetical protein
LHDSDEVFGTHKVMAAAGRVLFEENMADALVRDLSGA